MENKEKKNQAKLNKTQTAADRFTVLLLGIFLLGMSAYAMWKPSDEISVSERRSLSQLPAVTASSVLGGSFAESFEAYAQDQFPLRDRLRSLKAVTGTYVLRQLDQSGIYVKDGQASAYVYPENKQMMDYAADRIKEIYDMYLSGTDAACYFAVIPDKNCYMETLHPAMDYDLFIQEMEEKVPFLTGIALKDAISLEDFYTTDTHLRQDHMLPLAEKIADGMGAALETSYEARTLDEPFYGVYYGQSALYLQPDTITYLTNDTLAQCTVTSYDTGTAKPSSLYDFEKAGGNDAYEFFLSGSQALMTIENPNATTDRELILFRDSFGSSLSPLLAGSYAKITLVDTRYVSPALLGDYITFGDQDVLFLYSTLLLNNSLSLKK